MEMNYFKKTGKMMVAACMLAGLPFILFKWKVRH